MKHTTDSGRARPADAAAAPEVPPGYTSGYPPDSGQFSGGGTHLLDYVRILYRRRWLAGTTFLLIVVATIVYTYTRTPIYQARTQLQIDYVDQNVVPFRQVTENQVGWDTTEYFQTQVQDSPEPQPREAHARHGEPVEAPALRHLLTPGPGPPQQKPAQRRRQPDGPSTAPPAPPQRQHPQHLVLCRNPRPIPGDRRPPLGGQHHAQSQLAPR